MLQDFDTRSRRTHIAVDDCIYLFFLKSITYEATQCGVFMSLHNISSHGGLIKTKRYANIIYTLQVVTDYP